jgi:hypothetical protein
MQVAAASVRTTEGGLDAAAGDGLRLTRSAASLADLGGSRSASSAAIIEQYESSADEGDGDGGAGMVRLSFAWVTAASQTAAAACALRELNLKGQPLPQPAAAALALAVRQLPALRVLKLSDPFGLGEQQLAVLCPAAAAAPALQQLELQRCGTGLGSRGPLGLAAARAIAGMISAPDSQLTSLDLSFSCFNQDEEESDAIWSVLAGALVCSRQSRAGRRSWQRCLSSRPASVRGLEAALASAAAVSPAKPQQQHTCGGCRLQHLSLAHCGIPGSGADVLAAAVSSNAGVVSLDLSGLMQEVAAAAFREVLQACNAAALAAVAATSLPADANASPSGRTDACTTTTKSAATVASASATASVGLPGVCGCVLRSLKVTGEDYAVVDLMSGLRQQVLQRQAALQEDAERLCRGRQGYDGGDAALL